jgi:rSAM/selenodomain-associated transferase 1
MGRMTSSPVGKRVLGVFAKQAVPGQVKTRLAASRSAEWAAGVAAAFLGDSLDRFAQIDARRIVTFAPDSAAAQFATVCPRGFDLIPQGDGDLGRRLERFFGTQLRAGAESVVVVGTDSPTLPPAFIEQAFEAVATADVVLGPATDGGYYLIGCSRRVPPIFHDITWGCRTVLAQTVARLAEAALRLALLPPWYDVDTLDDWRMLCGHVAALRRAGMDPGVPCTEQLCLAERD